MMTGGAWGGAALVFVALIAYLVWQEARPIPRTGRDIPIMGAEHITVGQSHEPYNSDPPTSGPHYAEPAQAGFYDTAPADEYLVHSLEHGYVIISYNCSALSESECDGLKSQIQGVMGSAGNSLRTGTPKLIGAPRPTMATQIALTSWGRLDTFDGFDRQRILNFIRQFRDRAPEIQAP
jgi:hypothetical protein